MNIKTKKELKSILITEKKIYFKSRFEYFLKKMTRDERYLIYKYLKLLRKEEFLLSKGAKKSLRRFFVLRKRNILGNKINIKIVPFSLGIGPNIHHKNIIISGIVGDYCNFSGNNCIGLGKNGFIPTIGNSVTFGWGASAFGGVTVPDGCIVGAGCIIVKSIMAENSTVVGIPGKPIIRR